MKRIDLAIAFQASASIVCAQVDEPRIPLLADGFVSYGSFVHHAPVFGLSDWLNALPESQLLRGDLPSQGFSWGYGGGFGPYSALPSYGTGSAYLGVSLDPSRGASERSRFVKRLRVAVNLAGDDFLEGYWGRSLTSVYDTLVSQQTGAITLLDSTWTESYNASIHRSRIALDASYILRKASPRRLTWYCGVGMMFGLTFDGDAEVSHNVSRSRETVGSGGGSYAYDMIASERYRLPTTILAGGYGLFGLDLTLGRTSPFWNSLHLFSEARLILRAGSLPGRSMRIEESAQYLFGLRFDLR
ncbi:MAG: hypothetical protein IPL52_15000 [Flavobacteriales bacterium]|nr:hypothetical protein [Flavobacteriales bacterium]